MDLSEPQVMGILNVTPDSFYAASRKQTEQEIAECASRIVAEGGTIIDVGACSTRPGFQEISEAEEMERLRFGLGIVRRELPDAVVSVDTFRPDVARMAVEEFGVGIIRGEAIIPGSAFRIETISNGNRLQQCGFAAAILANKKCDRMSECNMVYAADCITIRSWVNWISCR